MRITITVLVFVLNLLIFLPTSANYCNASLNFTAKAVENVIIGLFITIFHF